MKTISITGFRSSVQDLADTKAIADSISATESTSISNVKPSVIGSANDIKTTTELGIVELTSTNGCVLSYKIIATNDAQGIVTVELSVSKEGETTVKTITISGYKTNDMETVENVLATINDSPSTSKSETLASTIGNVGDVVTVGLLGITNPTLNRTTITYQIEAINNATGTITLKAKVALGSYSKDKQIIVTGYITQDNHDVIQVLNAITSTYTTTNTTPRPSEIGAVNSTTSTANLGITLPADLKGTSVSLTIATINNSTGTLTLNVEVSKSGATDRSKTISVSGFRSSVNDQADVNVITTALSATATTTIGTSKPTDIASVNATKTATDLGITDPTQLNGSTIEYKVLSLSDDKGTISVEAKVTKEGMSSTKNITISGYKTTPMETIENVLSTVQDSQSTSKTEFLPSSIVSVGDRVIAAALGITNPPTQGSTITYLIQALNNANGEIQADVIVSIGSISVTKQVVITGYRTQANQDVTDVLSAFSATHTTTNTTPRPSEIGSIGTIVNATTLGITAPSDLKGTTISMKIASANDTSGELTVELEVSKSGATTKTKNITINGFRSAVHDTADVAGVMTALPTSISTSHTSVIATTVGQTGSTVTASDLGITESWDKNGTTITYTINSISNITGRITVTASVTKGTATDAKNINITGFRTAATITATEIIGTIQNSTTTIANTLPSAIYQVNSTYTPLELGISNPTDTFGATITYEVESINNTVGEITVLVTVTHKTVTETKTISIEGFTTPSDLEVRSVFNQFNDQYTTSRTVEANAVGNVNSETIDIDLGITSPSNTLGTTIKLIIKSIDNDNGIVVVTLSVAKANAKTETKTITIDGYSKP